MLLDTLFEITFLMDNWTNAKKSTMHTNTYTRKNNIIIYIILTNKHEYTKF